MDFAREHPALEYALGAPPARGRLRARAEDFRVKEIPRIEPSGEGEHVWLLLRKKLANTEWVSRQLARLAGVRNRDVGYAGLKDRNAVTEQWFSIHLPGREAPDWLALEQEGLTVLQESRHTRKLRRGTLQGNAFRIVVREIQGDAGELENRLARLAAEGVPNYFGEQRFGRNARNLHSAARLFERQSVRLSRHERGLVLSAARSFLYNRVLSRRVAGGNWNQIIPGDVLQLQGSHSYFAAAGPDVMLEQRMREQDLHPTGPLCGQGDNPASADCLRLEEETLADWQTWQAGLAQAGLKHDRRALRLPVEGLGWRQAEPDVLHLEFSLPAGAYATSVLRELIRYE